MCVSPNWAVHLETALFSLFSTNKCKIRLYILSDNLSIEQLQRYIKICNHFKQEFNYIDMTDYYNEYIKSDINVSSRFSKYTLYRIIIPKIINENKIIYVDADAIVTGSLEELWNIDLDENYIAGCPDTGLMQGYKESIGLLESDVYINAGFYIMNLDRFRNDKLDEEWLKLINNKFYLAHDQDTLNIVCRNRIKSLPFKYNVSLSTSLNVYLDDIVVCHYAGVKHPTEWVKGLPLDYIWEEWEYKYANVFRG